mmetsp:Transcript_9416/g.12297  ORF Transcript_9416/g.12297 Transcript_9416/m.12297 type:complete len:347 (+) Transcript_9416:72-1112(+)
MEIDKEKALTHLLAPLRDDAKWHWTKETSVERIENPSTLVFLRDYVAKNRPVILTSLPDVAKWQAFTNWRTNSGVAACTNGNVRVNVTPSGLGDAVVNTEENGEIFIKPYETQMTLEAFFASLQTSDDSVAYLSHQNDNLREEFPAMMNEIGENITIAHEAFGNDPEAVNIWIGDERSVSSMHKDFYENMYCVVRGEKVFHLLPPCAQPFLYEKEYQEAHYQYESNKRNWTIEMEDTKVPWSPIDPVQVLEQREDNKRYPLAAEIRELVMKATVRAGEVLYLPSMWYHRVTQNCLTIAVNYWHNMDFDLKWVYFSAIERMNVLLNEDQRKEAKEIRQCDSAKEKGV